MAISWSPVAPQPMMVMWLAGVPASIRRETSFSRALAVAPRSAWMVIGTATKPCDVSRSKVGASTEGMPLAGCSTNT